MRRIIGLLMDVRKDQLARQAKAGVRPTAEVNSRIAEVDASFRYLDNCLTGVHTFGGNELLREVMTSGDFTYAVQEFVQRRALPSYQQMMFPFEPLVSLDATLPNYLPVTRYQNRAGLDDLEFVGEKGQARPGRVYDATKRTLQVWRWEKQFDFSHELLVNDDLGYFGEVAEMAGRSGRRTLEKYVSRFYTNAVTIARLIALGALYSQNGRLTSGRVSEARMAFGQRVDNRNEPVNCDLAYIVHHRGLVDTVATIQNSVLVPELATNAANVVRATFMAIKDPYMAGAAPNLPWYAMADPNAAHNVKGLVLARRAGWPAPLILRKRSDIEAVTSLLGGGTPVDPVMGDFESGNIVIKVVDVFGTYIDATEGNMFDSRGLYYSTGTAP